MALKNQVLKESEYVKFGYPEDFEIDGTIQPIFIPATHPKAEEFVHDLRVYTEKISDLEELNEKLKGTQPFGHLTGVGIRLSENEGEKRTSESYLVEHRNDLRKYDQITINGCVSIVENPTEPLSWHEAYERAKRLSTLLPAKLSYVVLDTDGQMPNEIPDQVLTEVKAIHSQNSSSFYAKFYIV